MWSGCKSGIKVYNIVSSLLGNAEKGGKGGENHVIRSERKRTGLGRVCVDSCFGSRCCNCYPCSTRPGDRQHFLERNEQHLRTKNIPQQTSGQKKALNWAFFWFLVIFIRFLRLLYKTVRVLLQLFCKVLTYNLNIASSTSHVYI